VLIARLVELGHKFREGWWIAQDVLVHDLAGALDHGVVDGVGLRVVLREAGDLAYGVVHLFPEDDAIFAIHERGEGARVALDHLDAVVEQVEILQHFLRRQREHIRAGGSDVAGSAFDLLGEGGAADILVAFEDADGVPGTCEVAGGYQPVVAAADDDDIIGIAGHLVHRS
jgi:hypothetical protein